MTSFCVFVFETKYIGAISKVYETVLFEIQVVYGFLKSIAVLPSTAGAVRRAHKCCEGCFTNTSLFEVPMFEMFDEQWCPTR